MKKNRKNIYNFFPKQMKEPKKGDVWVAKFPFREKGCFEKVRPVLVIYVDEENEIYYCRSFTTNKSKGTEVSEELKKYFNKTPYLTDNVMGLKIEKFYKRLYKSKDNSNVVWKGY